VGSTPLREPGRHAYSDLETGPWMPSAAEPQPRLLGSAHCEAAPQRTVLETLRAQNLPDSTLAPYREHLEAFEAGRPIRDL